jgi:tRNA(Ile)-lysidine synthetase-like protein
LRTAKRLHLLSPEQNASSEKWPELDDLFVMEALDANDEADVSNTYGDGIRTQTFDADKIGGAVFRYRQNGDLFSPIGGTGTQKLKQTLRDAGVDRPFRALLPVFAVGQRVLWIVGLKPASDAAITLKTKKRVKITYQGKLPWEL